MTPSPDDLPVAARIRDLATQRSEILKLSPEKALARILDAPQPVPLVHSFPAQEFYLLVKDIGPEDALPLLAMAAHRQLEHLLDLELWQRDRISLAAAERWIDLLLKADRRRLADWLQDEKSELLELLLYYDIDVVVRDHDQDPGDLGDGLTTFDNVYYFRVRERPASDDPALGPEDAEHRRTTIHTLLESLAEHDHPAYLQLLMRSRSVLGPEAEEDAFHWRRARLAEMGLPPFEEAVGVYQSITATQMAAAAPKSERWFQGPMDAHPSSTPQVPAQLLDGESLFARAMAQIDSENQRDGLQRELAGLCNQLMVADAIAVADRESLRPAVRKAAGYLSIGLETACGAAGPSILAEAAALLRHHPLTRIFRVGYGAALALKWRADRWRKTCWSLNQGGFPLTFWDEPWFGILGGLLLKRPLCYDPTQTGRPYREFERLSEITVAEAACLKIAAADGLLDLIARDLGEAPDTRGHMTYKRFLLTLWARSALGLSHALQPIPLSRFKPFFDALWAGKGPARRLTPDATRAFHGWVVQATGLTDQALAEMAGPVLDGLLKIIEDELGGVQPSDLDPRFTAPFWLEP